MVRHLVHPMQYPFLSPSVVVFHARSQQRIEKGADSAGLLSRLYMGGVTRTVDFSR